MTDHTTETTMRAITRDRYGDPATVLSAGEIGVPSPASDQVLVRVEAACVNPADWHLITGTPMFMRLTGTGFRRPKKAVPGLDLAGVVVAVGDEVTRFHPGDEVFGDVGGAFAEFAVAPERALAHKPPTLSFEEAASIPVAALTALQGLRDKGELEAGASVLVNGGAGGVGTFAVQIAKAMGAEVTAVCSGRNVEMVRDLGADRVVDYTAEDPTAGEHRYDVILDNVGNWPLRTCRRLLKSGGRYVPVSGPKGRWIRPVPRMIAAMVSSKLRGWKVRGFTARANADDLAAIGDLVESGDVRIVIDRTYSLAEVPQALEYLATGHARAKIAITI